MRVDFDFLNIKFQTNENTTSRVALCFRIKGQLKQIIRLRLLVDLFFLIFVKIQMNFCFLLPNETLFICNATIVSVISMQLKHTKCGEIRKLYMVITSEYYALLL